jgi:hypothetical protein
MSTVRGSECIGVIALAAEYSATTENTHTPGEHPFDVTGRGLVGILMLAQPNLTSH